MNPSVAEIPVERIEKSIYLIRGEKVMLDRALASLYGVTTKAFNQAVKRHRERFPTDFMFQLTMEEAQGLRSRSQSVTLKRGQNIKYRPYAFTEHGILMLSSVLNSERAVQVNIEIMRTFVRLRRLLASNVGLAKKLEELERKYDHQFSVVFDAIHQLMIPLEPKRKQIWIRKNNEEMKSSGDDGWRRGGGGKGKG
ncbi:MAG TPA: ORF6N domain-containing protein [Pyrinomonadaceae bacterium]|nr:ORF6N domain-containing protein [Pyrinomonadaceae bacterium]